MRTRVLPWLLVLPALLFVSPASPLADDPYPHLAGTGWAVLALVPLALALALRGASLRPAWPFLALLAWGLVSWRLAPVTDTFEARRALLVLCTLPLALAGGAALDPAGKVRLQWLALLLACGWTGLALWQGFRDGNFAGVLGDTGSLSQAALPGAAIGAVWLVSAERARRVAGGVALSLFLVHVAAAPVLAGSHTLLAGLLLAVVRGPGKRRGALGALALVALVAPFAGMALRQAFTGATPSLEGAPSAPSHSLGGLGVRALVWRASLGLIGDHALLGAGPGQFQAAFPPYRDPREIELSRHGTCSELDTEVEHAHNDWLQSFCELGLTGGALFALGFGLCLRAALRGARRAEDLPLAVAALAILVNSFVHAPLWANPAASVLACGLFGALRGDESGRPSRAGSAVLALPLLLAVPAALPLVRFGQAACAYIDAARGLSRLPRVDGVDGSFHPQDGEPLLEALHAAIVRAGEVSSEAVAARILAARAAAGSPGDRSAESWDAVLEERPHMVEAWEQSATLHAVRGEYAEAQARYARALELSPTHPRILRNAARLEWTQGDPGLGQELVARLREPGCLAPEWLEALGGELVLELGRPEPGARLLFGTPLAELSPEELHARASGKEGEADAAECLAQLGWAREHAGRGDFALALRNYRQAAERSHARRGTTRGPAPLYALEQAAAEARLGRDAEARARVAAAHASADDWGALQGWAAEALIGLGLERPR
jgi:O-antigen ligase